MKRNVTARLGPACGWLLAVGLGAVLTLPGCGRQTPANRHDVLAGSVQSVHAETGQLTVRQSFPRPEIGDNPTVSCLLSSDAEVYINDKFSAIDAIVAGDNIELIGYRDPNPRAERFLVSLVHITRSEPLPPAPDLAGASAASTVPARVQEP